MVCKKNKKRKEIKMKDVIFIFILFSTWRFKLNSINKKDSYHEKLVNIILEKKKK